MERVILSTLMLGRAFPFDFTFACSSFRCSRPRPTTPMGCSAAQVQQGLRSDALVNRIASAKARSD